MKFEFLYPALVRAVPPRSSSEKRCYVVLKGEVDLPVYDDREIPFVGRARGRLQTVGFRNVAGQFYASIGTPVELMRFTGGAIRTGGRRLGPAWKRMVGRVVGSIGEGDVLAPRYFRERVARGNADDVSGIDVAAGKYTLAELRNVSRVDLDFWNDAAETELRKHFVCGRSVYGPVSEPFLKIGFGHGGTEIGVGYYDAVPETRVYPYTSDRTYHPYYAFLPMTARDTIDGRAFTRSLQSDTLIEEAKPEFFGQGWEPLELDRSARAVVVNFRRDLRDNSRKGGWTRGMPLDVRAAWEELFAFTRSYRAADGVPDELADYLSELHGCLDRGKADVDFGGTIGLDLYEDAMRAIRMTLDGWDARPVDLFGVAAAAGVRP